MVCIVTLLYGSESWTVLTRCESRIPGAEMRYCRHTRRDRIRSSQIWGVLNEVPVTEMIDRWELRWFGHQIRMDNNRKPSHRIEELRVYGKRKGEGRVGGACVKADDGESDDLKVWDWAGDGQECVLDRPDGTRCLRRQQGTWTGRRSLKDDVGPCTIKKVEAMSCQQQRNYGWLR